MTDLVGREFSFDVEASLDLVWDALTTGEGLATWYVAEATVEPVVGGGLEVDWGTGSYAMGKFDVVEPPRRIRLVYEGTEVGSEEWLLTHEKGVTHVRLIHSLVVDEGATWDDLYGDIARGWLLFHSTMQWVASTVGTLGRRSEVRLGPISDGSWPRVLAALGCAAPPSAGSVVTIGDLPTGEVLVSVDGYSLLLRFGDNATLLVDVEGESLYTLSATYAAETEDTRVLRASLVDLAERLCAASGPPEGHTA